MAVIGFKEWVAVCEAIGSGRQDVIFRKGGIHEGRVGFSFKYEEFYLFPTLFHAQGEYLREGKAPKKPEWEVNDRVEIHCHCKVKKALTLTDWRQVESYASRHIWTEALIRERFDWQGKGMASGSIHVAELEVTVLARPWVLEYQKKFGGCRSWIELPHPAVQNTGKNG